MGCCEHVNETSVSVKIGYILSQLNNYQLFEENFQVVNEGFASVFAPFEHPAAERIE